MNCPKCGFMNHENAKFCKKCGTNLQTQVSVNSTPVKSNNNNNLIIICVAVIICIAIICGAILFISHNSENNSPLDNIVNTEDSSSSSSSASMISHDCKGFSLTLPSSWTVEMNSKAEANGCIGSVKDGSHLVAWLFIVDDNPSTLDHNMAATYLSSYSYSYLNQKTIGSHKGFISDAHPNGKAITQEAFIFLAHGKAYMIVLNTGDYGKEAYKVVEGFK